MLTGTSMSMHFTGTVLTPMRGGDIQGAFVILEGMMDKRQLFFPFLVSILHDLTGYRPENAFVLNGILTFVFLGLVNAAGRKLAGRTAGWLGVALFAGLPLLGQNATGGGFELLNLVMILATMLLGARYIARRDEPSFTAFCYSAMLLDAGPLRVGGLPAAGRRRSSSGSGGGRAGDHALAGHCCAAPHDPLRAPQADLRHPDLGVAAAEQARSSPGLSRLWNSRTNPRARLAFLLREVDGPAQFLGALRASAAGAPALLSCSSRSAAGRSRSESPISVATCSSRSALRPSWHS